MGDLIAVAGLDHSYGKAETRLQVLFEVGLRIAAGEIGRAHV